MDETFHTHRNRIKSEINYLNKGERNRSTENSTYIDSPSILLTLG